MNQSRQRGVAVLTAMLVVTIATVIAVNLLWETGVDIQRTENLLLKDQSREYCLLGESFAVLVLEEDLRIDPQGRDSRDEAWSRVVRAPLDGAELAGYLEDMQGRFNLNNLVDAAGKPRPVFVEQFERLLRVMDPQNPLDDSTASALTDRVIDWLDPDGITGPNGAEDNVYTGRVPPMRPANFWFVSPSELLAIEGMTPALYAALEPNVTALPPRNDGLVTKLNINTAPPGVLASLAPDVGMGDVTGFVDGQYDDVAEFTGDFGYTIPPELQVELQTSSSWFRATVTTSIGATRTTLYSLLQRRSPTDVQVRLRSYDVG